MPAITTKRDRMGSSSMALAKVEYMRKACELMRKRSRLKLAQVYSNRRFQYFHQDPVSISTLQTEGAKRSHVGYYSKKERCRHCWAELNVRNSCTVRFRSRWGSRRRNLGRKNELVYTCKTCHKSTCMPGTPYVPPEYTGGKRKVKREDNNNSQDALKKQQHVEKGGKVGNIRDDQHENREDAEKMQQIPSFSRAAKHDQDILNSSHPIHTVAASTLLDQLERRKKKRKKKQQHDAK